MGKFLSKPLGFSFDLDLPTEKHSPLLASIENNYPYLLKDGISLGAPSTDSFVGFDGVDDSPLLDKISRPSINGKDSLSIVQIRSILKIFPQ